MIIWEMVRMGPFYHVLGSSLDRNMCDTVQLCALEILRYAASEWAERCMLLAM